MLHPEHKQPSFLRTLAMLRPGAFSLGYVATALYCTLLSARVDFKQICVLAKAVHIAG